MNAVSCCAEKLIVAHVIRVRSAWQKPKKLNHRAMIIKQLRVVTLTLSSEYQVPEVTVGVRVARYDLVHLPDGLWEAVGTGSRTNKKSCRARSIRARFRVRAIASPVH